MADGFAVVFAIAFALKGACKLVRGLRQELTEEEGYRVADDVVNRLKQHCDAAAKRAFDLSGRTLPWHDCCLENRRCYGDVR